MHVFWTCHAGSRRSASLPRPMSGRAMVTGPPSPHLSSPFASFRVFRGPHSLAYAKRSRDRNPIPDRSSCPLRPSVHLLFLHWVPVDNGFPEAKRDASPIWTSRTLRACHSSLQARRHRVLCGCGYAALLPAVQILFCKDSSAVSASFLLYLREFPCNHSRNFTR